jgi:hypothetical protein
MSTSLQAEENISHGVSPWSVQKFTLCDTKREETLLCSSLKGLPSKLLRSQKLFSFSRHNSAQDGTVYSRVNSPHSDLTDLTPKRHNIYC